MRHFCTIEDDLEPSKNVYLLFEKKPVENNIWSSKLHKADIEARYDSVIRKISQVRITNKACVKKKTLKITFGLGNLILLTLSKSKM